MVTKPTLDYKDYIDKLCELVSTDEYSIKELCHNVGIAEGTFYNWKRENEDFVAQLKEADQKRLEFFKVEARKAALKKLQGYDYTEEHITMVDDGLGKPKIKEKKTVKRHVAPSDTQIMYVLNNTDPDNFAYKEKHEHSGSIEQVQIYLPDNKRNPESENN